MLIGKGDWENTGKQAALTCVILTHVCEAALLALEKIDGDAGFKENYARTFQAVS